MVTWADLGEIEQDVIVLASEEARVWEVCGRFGRDDGSIRPPIDVPIGQAVTRELVDLGLVAFYRLAEPDNDLSAAEVADLFASTTAWTGPSAPAMGVTLYLTPEGEALYYDMGN